MACNILKHCKLCNLTSRIVNSLASRNIHSNSNEKADIVISGGGMVGTAMACALGNLSAYKCLMFYNKVNTNIHMLYSVCIVDGYDFITTN